MEVTAKRVTDWSRVLNAARMTAHKDHVDREPTDAFKEKIIRAEHSPIRLLEYDITIKDVPYYAIMHLVRHFLGIEKFVATSRPDRGGKPRDEQKKTDPVDCQFSVNSQALINISRKRLCHQAEAETYKVWCAVKKAIAEIDPIVADAMVPECVYRGFCPEINCCGFCASSIYREWRARYIGIPDDVIKKMRDQEKREYHREEFKAGMQ